MHPASTVIFENKYVQKIAQEKNSTFFSCKKAFLCFSFKELLSSKVVYLQIQVVFSCFFGAA